MPQNLISWQIEKNNENLGKLLVKIMPQTKKNVAFATKFVAMFAKFGKFCGKLCGIFVAFRMKFFK